MKKTLLFKSIVLSLFMLFGIGVLNAQVLLEENFDYPVGSLLTANGWTAHSGAGSQAVDVTTGLSFAGYLGSNIGGAANLDNTGEDVTKAFTTQTSGTIYYSALVKVDVAVEGYFLHLSASATSFAARIFVKPSSTAGKINFGFSNISTISNALYAATPTDFDPETTYLIIVKYDVSTTGNGSMWVISSGVPATEAIAGTPEHITTASGQASIIGVSLRQYTATQRIVVDGIRVGTTWADITTVSTGINDLYDVDINIYPNPSNGKFFIQMGNAFKANTKIEVFNVVGMKVFETLTNEYKTEIDLRSVKQGVYYVRVDDGVNVHTQKVMKQ